MEPALTCHRGSAADATAVLRHGNLCGLLIGVSNEIGDSSVDCQSYVAFVIELEHWPKHHVE
jgi:hypothetical protein